MQALSNADILIYNSNGMERWVKQAVKAADNKKLITVEASKGIKLIGLTDPKFVRSAHRWQKRPLCFAAAGRSHGTDKRRLHDR